MQPARPRPGSGEHLSSVSGKGLEIGLLELHLSSSLSVPPFLVFPRGNHLRGGRGFT